MSSIIETNPTEFLAMLERTNPEAARNFHEKMASAYVERYGGREEPTKQNGEAKTADPELWAEVKSLREQVQASQTREQQREWDKQLLATQGRFNGRVDELMGSEGVKALNLTKSEQRAMRADLQTELAKDPATAKRISNGNFVDVPRTFKTIIEAWAGDRKAASEADKTAREKQSERSFSEFQTGPGIVSKSDVDKSLEGPADDWDATIREFSAALSRA
jgi:hypothetical protein